jgi:hypothetical protein
MPFHLNSTSGTLRDLFRKSRGRRRPNGTGATARRSLPDPERLEARRLLAITPLLSGRTVTFLSDDPTDILYLRVSDGLLEYKTSAGGTYTDQLGSGPGPQTLDTSADATIVSRVQGTTYIDTVEGSGGGLTIEDVGQVAIIGDVSTRGGSWALSSDGGIDLAGGVAVSSRDVAAGDDPRTGPSTGDSGASGSLPL